MMKQFGGGDLGGMLGGLGGAGKKKVMKAKKWNNKSVIIYLIFYWF